MLLALATVAGGVVGQQVIFRAGGVLVGDQRRGEDESGPAVELFESPNLDRFLRRARQFLVEEKYQEAILVLQAVIEGRTLEAAGASEPATGNAGNGGNAGSTTAAMDPAAVPTGATETRTGTAATPSDHTPSAPSALTDPAQTVFSADGRIYRPARRLCHEYLASMPATGHELYRSLYESQGQDLLQQAQASGRASDLERVANRYFPTLAAGAAMQQLADRWMHQGQFRAAVQVLRDLGELYPRDNMQALGISALWCRFKIALCLRLAGEVGAAQEAARALAEEFGDESLRVMGELQAVRELPQSPVFASDDGSIVEQMDIARGRGTNWLDQDTQELVGLWQYRFAGPDPYEPRQTQQQDNMWEAQQGTMAPPAHKYGTGTQIVFSGEQAPARRAVFLENFRLRMADACTGIVQREGDGEAVASTPAESRARARVPVYDFTLLTPVEDEQRCYAILGRNKISTGVDSLKVNHLVAYDKATCQRVWSSESFAEGEDGLLDVTFLAAPTVFGERLLLPTLRRGAYELQCLDRSTGRPLWHTRIHSGGTPYFKAPGAHVLVAGNLCYVLTNAGCIAAVDAFAGDLRWIRRYERTDPLREKPVGRSAPSPGGQVWSSHAFFERDLPSFLPSAVLASGGTIVFAACDSDMVLCIDGASGEPVWMLDGSSRYLPWRLRYLIGRNATHLYLAADGDAQQHVVCVDLASGVVLWSRPVPRATDQLSRWPGRGCVLDDHVCMPGDREIHVLAADGKTEWRRLSLPAFGLGDEPLRGPNNLYCSGPWLGVTYALGLEVYSTAAALRTLASSSTEIADRAALLVQAGNVADAIAALADWLARPDLEATVRRQGEEQLVGLARHQALTASKPDALDAVGAHTTTRTARLAWHLARLDLWLQISDLRSFDDEQQRLYRYMEGKD